MQNFAALIFFQLLAVLLAEVTVLKTDQYIYDTSPKLRIRGSGFDAEDHDIILEVGVSGQPNLSVDRDFTISKDPGGEEVVLQLLGNRKWVDLSKRTPPVALILNAVRFSIDPEKKNLLPSPKKNLLPSPVIVAQVLNTPKVEEYKRMIYQTATKELHINGTGFIGAKKVDFYFKPPLMNEVAYEDVTPYPLMKNEIVLRLHHGYSWREEPGPLYLVGVDTGGGPVMLNGEGVHIAHVQLDRFSNTKMNRHSNVPVDRSVISVESTASSQLIYADEPSLLITGSGFNPVGNTLRFANGSYWRKNFDNLPGELTLLAVNAGQGFIAVGPSNAARGRDIATVFERPAIYSNNKKIYKTHSHELHVMGTGFPLANTDYKPQLKFNPPLKEGVDYKLRVAGVDYELELRDKNRVVIHLRAGVQEQLARDGSSSPKTVNGDVVLEVDEDNLPCGSFASTDEEGYSFIFDYARFVEMKEELVIRCEYNSLEEYCQLGLGSSSNMTSSATHGHYGGIDEL
eukprot:gene5463-6016_t